MRSKREIDEELGDLEALKGLTETYEEVAVANMQKIREAVISTRMFLSGVEEIHSLARAAYISHVLMITNRRQRRAQLDFINKNKKTVVIFISGNHSLLGNVLLSTYKVFLEITRSIECDKVILGSIGKYLASGEKSTFKFTYFDLNDFYLDYVQIRPIINFIARYQKILVVYPQFKTVLLQLPQVEDISGGVKVEQSMAGKKRYFFEPSAKEVMVYFDQQIIGTLFKQKVLETMLAKFASRLKIMDDATQTIEGYVIKNRFLATLAKRRHENKKLLESFAGISLWTKG